MDVNEFQRIFVIDQAGRGRKKIHGLLEFGQGDIKLEIFTITEDLPAIIDDGRIYLPEIDTADLVLDYLIHLDLSYDLSLLCREKDIPVVASGKKMTIKSTFTPPVCCALPFHSRLGCYGRRFGRPEFEVTVKGGLVERINVKRGAPCGATWQVAQKVIGQSPEEAAIGIGLKSQFLCSADPSGWDPINGKSPVHLAGHLHRAAFLKGIRCKS
ncbi:MAG: DUF166 family (seleno)protein DfsP [Desulfobacteraceae bacterium]|jgi:hypothetical protein